MEGLRSGAPQVRVRVWFGEHAIADYQAIPELAESYAAAMSRRFSGLRVTCDLADTDQGSAS